MATEKCSFFDSTDEDIREYAAEEFAEYFGSVIGNGIFNGGTSLQVYADGTGQSVCVRPGRAWINGYYYALISDSMGTDKEIALEAADASNDRIDAVVLRLDTSVAARRIALYVIKGTAAASPTAPTPARSGEIYDLVLAHVRVKANTLAIAAGSVTDKRLDAAVCGTVNSLITVDLSHMQAVFDKKEAEWTKMKADDETEWSALMTDCNSEWNGWMTDCSSEWAAECGAMPGVLAGTTAANQNATRQLAARQVRNIIISTDEPTQGVHDGDIWLRYVTKEA